jgi:hypothetical protein
VPLQLLTRWCCYLEVNVGTVYLATQRDLLAMFFSSCVTIAWSAGTD